MSAPSVCLIISSFRPVIGGAEIRTERLARKLLARGLDLVVLTRRYPGLSPHETNDGLPIRRAGLPGRGKLASLTFVLHSLWILAREIRKCEVVHVQSQDAPLLIGMAARAFLGKRLIMTVRSDPERVWGSMGRIRARLFPRLVDHVAGLSPAMSAKLSVAGLPPSRIACLPGGVDTATIRPPTQAQRDELRRRMGINAETIVFLFVGRLDPVKELPTLLRAWKLSESTAERKLMIVGDGPQRNELEALAAANGSMNVSFAGESDDVLSYLHSADVFVLPSRWEGVSNALLEAMSAGLTVVASGIPGNRAVVEDGVSGVLFATANPDSLSKALRLVEDGSIRERLGARARARVEERYSLEASVLAHAELYAELVDGTPREVQPLTAV